MNGEAINVSEVLRIPPLIDIRELIAASSEIEKCEYENRLLEMRWISQLVQPDSFLGRVLKTVDIRSPKTVISVHFSYSLPMAMQIY